MEIKKFQLQDHFLKCVVYGSSNAGKTTFGSTAPKPIFASVENGLLSIAKLNPDFVEIKTMQDLKDLMFYLKKGGHGFETLVVDTISAISEVIKRNLAKKRGGTMQQQDWGLIANELTDLFIEFRNLSMHVILLAQEKIEKDEDKIVRIFPELDGSSAVKLPRYFDVVGYISAQKGKAPIVTMEQDPILASKDRSNVIRDIKEPNFQLWVDALKTLATGAHKVVGNIESEPTTPKAPPKVSEPTNSPRITPLTAEALRKNWSTYWTLGAAAESEKLTRDGAPFWALENSEKTLLNTLKTKYSTDGRVVAGTLDLYESEGAEFYHLLEAKISEYMPKIEAQPKAETPANVDPATGEVLETSAPEQSPKEDPLAAAAQIAKAGALSVEDLQSTAKDPDDHIAKASKNFSKTPNKKK